MKECLFTEFKTLFRSKYIYIGLLVLIIFATFFNYSSYNNAIESINYNADIYEDLLTCEDSFDASSLTQLATEYYETFHPNMTVNNVLSVLIGLGIIILPILSSIYIGTDYGKSNMIRSKICHYSLVKVLVSKLVCIVIAIIIAILVYLVVSFAMAYSIWPNFETALNRLPIEFPVVAFNIGNAAKTFVLTFAIFIFYSLATATVSVLFKNSISGIILTIAVNYVFLPFEFAPHNVIYALINECFIFTSASPAVFTSNFAQPTLSTMNHIIIFTVYFIVLICAYLLIGKKQRN
ncbi:MAG: hypothetical protein UH241_00475 [Acutalibacteraceae bacterium]|nr:hypothetical protein [Acutalibacteraceae bacterium]